MGFLHELSVHRDSLVRGLTLILGGLALVLVGTLVGLGATKWFQVAAGSLAVTGIVVAFLGLFVYIIPPMLPAK